MKYIPGLQEVYDEVVAPSPYKLQFVPDHFKTQEMCNNAVREGTYSLRFVPDHLKTQEMCDNAVDIEPRPLAFAPERFKRFMDPWSLKIIPDHFKTQEIYDKVVDHSSYSVIHVPDWFVIQQQAGPWHDDDNYDELIEWYNGYKKRKTKKTKIEEELILVAWHLSRWWDWRVPEDEKKKRYKNYRHKYGLFLIGYKNFLTKRKLQDVFCHAICL